MQRTTLISGLVVALFIGVSISGAQTDYYATKDAGIPGHSTEDRSNSGGSSTDRTLKHSQHIGIYDFDTATILTDLNAAGILDPGAAVTAGLLKVEFAVAQAGTGYNGINAEVRTILCDSSWSEGDGPRNWSNFNWTVGYTDAEVGIAGVAATHWSPQQNLAGTSTVRWGVGSGGPTRVTSAAFTSNTAGLLWDNVADSYALAALDAAVVTELLFDPNNRGLYTYYGAGTNSRGGRFIETGGTNLDPKLIVTIIPEPATMALLGLGMAGLAAIRRRRR